MIKAGFLTLPTHKPSRYSSVAEDCNLFIFV